MKFFKKKGKDKLQEYARKKLRAEAMQHWQGNPPDPAKHPAGAYSNHASDHGVWQGAVDSTYRTPEYQKKLTEAMSATTQGQAWYTSYTSSPGTDVVSEPMLEECPQCEQQKEILNDDYLCKECRYG